MKSSKIFISAILALAVVFSAGCMKTVGPGSSAPAVSAVETTAETETLPSFTAAQKAAAVIDMADGDTKATITGDQYLAYLYANFYQLAQPDGAAAQGQTQFTYQGQTYDFETYLKLISQDAIIRAQAVNWLLAKYHVTLPADQVQTIESNVAAVTDDQLAQAGCSRGSYSKMQINSQLGEKALFNGAYSPGGPLAATDSELITYLNGKVIRYKQIEYTFSTMSSTQQESTLGLLETYKGYYEDEKDFDKLIAFDKESGVNYGSYQYTPDPQVDNDIVIWDGDTPETALLGILQSMQIGEAKVTTYTNAAGNLTGVLLLRLDPAHDEPPAQYVSENRDEILYYDKMPAYTKMVEDYISGLTVTRHQDALDALSPTAFNPP